MALEKGSTLYSRILPLFWQILPVSVQGFCIIISVMNSSLLSQVCYYSCTVMMVIVSLSDASVYLSIINRISIIILCPCRGSGWVVGV